MSTADGPDDPKGQINNLALGKMRKEPTRAEGYYWVKYKGEWTIANFFGKWEVFGDPTYNFNDIDFDEIDENRIERQRILSERELDAIASGRSLWEDEYKGFIAGYKYAKSGD